MEKLGKSGWGTCLWDTLDCGVGHAGVDGNRCKGEKSVTRYRCECNPQSSVKTLLLGR